MSQIICYDSDGNALKRLFQWDSGRVITVKGVDTSNTIVCHFSNRLSKEALIVTPTTVVDGFTVHVPNILLQQAEPLNLYIFETDDEEHMTTHVVTIPVTPRTMPSGYEYDEGIDYLDIVGLTDEVNTLRESVEDDQAAIYTATENANTAADNANAAAEIGSVVAQAMAQYNGYDVLAQTARRTSTNAGITFTWNDNECDIDGTLTGDSAYQMLYDNASVLPYMIKPGGVLRLKQSISPAWIGLSWHNGTSWSEWGYRSSTVSINVPSDTVGVRLDIGVSRSQGETYNHSKVKVGLMTDVPTNDELSEKMDVLYQSRLIIARGVNLDDVRDPGYYLLNSGYDYINAPHNQTYGAFLEVVPSTTNSIMQRLTVNVTNEVFFRSSSMGSFANRAWTRQNPYRRLNGAYVAFGDSLMAGAVWSDANHQSEPLHIADESLKIPTRIANAVGAINNYANEAIGGIGYIKKLNSQNLVDQITSYDFTGVELVTIHGGANDKLTSAGTLDAICAAIKSIITYLRTNYPKTQLVIIQPLPSGFTAAYDPWTARGAGGWSMSDFDQRVSKLCHENHVGYVNWFGCLYCDTWATRNIGYNNNIGPNYTHPIVDEDYALLGDFIAGKIAAYGINTKAQSDQAPVEMTDRLTASTYISESEVYSFRSSECTERFSNIKREEIVGGTLVWNQLASSTWRSADVTPDGTTSYSYFGTTGIMWRKDHVIMFSAELQYTGSDTSRPIGAWLRIGAASDPATQLITLWDRSDDVQMNTGVKRRCFCISKYVGSLPEYQVPTSFGISIASGIMPSTDTWHFDNMMGFDLTAMFGQDIADWLLVQGAEVAGNWFTNLFPKSYYYHADRSLMSVRARRSETIGANLLDPETGKAKISANTIYVLRGITETPTVSFVDLNGDTTDIEVYYANNMWCVKSDRAGILTVSGSLGGVWLCMHDRIYSTVISQDMDTYEKHVYPLDERPLYGIPKLDSLNALNYDGDIYTHDGTITRNCAYVNLGAMTWVSGGTDHVFTCAMNYDFSTTVFANRNDVRIGGVFSTHPSSLNSLSELEDGQWYIPPHCNWIAVRNDNASTPAEMKTAMSGVMCVYKKASATTEAAGPFIETQVLDPYGTEEFVDAGVELGERDVAIPVGHNTKYIDNLRYKLEKLPWPSYYRTGNCFISNGQGGQMSLTSGCPSIPDAPSVDGSYRLVATVVNGAPKYKWVSD